jgi:hypothetical protein
MNMEEKMMKTREEWQGETKWRERGIHGWGGRREPGAGFPLKHPPR